MSLKSTQGTSLIEVMVMMIILSISVLGIYGMIKSGQDLARLSNARLSAINIAREGLESVTTLRDTFGLNRYESGSCMRSKDPLNGNIDEAFFSTDGHILLDNNCPIVNTASINATYLLGDDKTLVLRDQTTATKFDVCMNPDGWYAQEFITLGGETLATCRGISPPPGCNTCANTVALCEANTTSSCKTPYKRKITFQACTDITNPLSCIKVVSRVWWGMSETDPATSLELSQIITTLN